MKTCIKCGRPFPRTHDHFHRDRHNKDGLRNDCKKCVNKRNKKWRKEHPDYWKEWNRKHPNYMSDYWEEWAKRKWIEDPQYMVNRRDILETYSPYEFHMMIPEEIKMKILKDLGV